MSTAGVHIQPRPRRVMLSNLPGGAGRAAVSKGYPPCPDADIPHVWSLTAATAGASCGRAPGDNSTITAAGALSGDSWGYARDRRG